MFEVSGETRLWFSISFFFFSIDSRKYWNGAAAAPTSRQPTTRSKIFRASHPFVVVVRFEYRISYSRCDINTVPSYSRDFSKYCKNLWILLIVCVQNESKVFAVTNYCMVICRKHNLMALRHCVFFKLFIPMTLTMAQYFYQQAACR